MSNMINGVSKNKVYKESLIEKIRAKSAVILVTDHDAFDYSIILENSKCIIDTRGKYSDNLALRVWIKFFLLV